MEDSVQQDRIPNGIQVGSKRKTEERESSDNNRDHSHTKETKQKSKKIKDSNDKKEEVLDNQINELATIEDKKEGKRKRKNRQDSEGHVKLSFEEKGIHTEQNIEPKDKKKKKKKFPIENEEGSVISNENGGGELLTEKNKRRHQSSNKEAINDLSEDNASGVVGDTIHSTEKDDHTLSRTVENEVLNRANGHGEQPFAKFQKNATPPAFVRRCSAKTPRTEPRKNNNLKVGNNIFFISVK